jgi:hypothetical protein
MNDAEWEAIRRAARSEQTTVSEWVRRSLRNARRQQGSGNVDTKLAVLRAATRHDFPSGDIDDMLAEIERGYVE